jgi:hypothetical protein
MREEPVAAQVAAVISELRSMLPRTWEQMILAVGRELLGRRSTSSQAFKKRVLHRCFRRPQLRAGSFSQLNVL